MYFQFKTYCVLIQENKIELLIILLGFAKSHRLTDDTDNSTCSF